MRKRSEAGEAFTELVLELLATGGAVERHGARLARTVGLTPSQWQVMGGAWNESRTVPQIARRMGLSRQACHRTAQGLVANGLARLESNPDHRSSPFLRLTARGVRRIERLNEEQIRWSNHVGGGLNRGPILAAARALRRVREALETDSDDD